MHTVLTDNGTHFTKSWQQAVGRRRHTSRNRRAGERFWAHSFELACAENDIDHRLTKPCHPWTNGQVERMNRTLKEATVRSYHYETHDQLRDHLAAFVGAYNFAKRLKTLGGQIPFQAICKVWTEEPHRFSLSPNHLTSD